jgi:hypothetical protein
MSDALCAGLRAHYPEPPFHERACERDEAREYLAQLGLLDEAGAVVRWCGQRWGWCGWDGDGLYRPLAQRPGLDVGGTVIVAQRDQEQASAGLTFDVTDGGQDATDLARQSRRVHDDVRDFGISACIHVSRLHPQPYQPAYPQHQAYRSEHLSNLPWPAPDLPSTYQPCFRVTVMSRCSSGQAFAHLGGLAMFKLSMSGDTGMLIHFTPSVPCSHPVGPATVCAHPARTGLIMPVSDDAWEFLPLCEQHQKAFFGPSRANEREERRATPSGRSGEPGAVGVSEMKLAGVKTRAVGDSGQR